MRTIGRFKVIEELARGGMGVVYKALDPQTHAPVAVKVLTRGQDSTPEQRRRFKREAAALAKVEHRNVVRLRDTGEHEGTPFLVLDYHAEGSLEATLEVCPLSPTLATRIGVGLTDALAAAHAEGVLHRDLKPSNVLLSTSGNVLVTDFGLAKCLDGEDSQSITKKGAALGTPGFWAPEQAAGEPAQFGPWTDVYGVGATLYAALTGNPPIDGESFIEILCATRDQAPTPIRDLRADVPADLEAIVLRCLEKDPQDRFPSMAELRRALGESLLRPEAPGAPARPLPDQDLPDAGVVGWGRPVTIAVGALVGAALVLVLALAALFLSREPSADPTASTPSVGAATTPDPTPAAPSERRELIRLSQRGTELVLGLGVKKDVPAGLALLRQAGEAGHLPAMLTLNRFLSQAPWGSQDKEATRWLVRAANAGDKSSMYRLGQRFLKGRGVAPDAVAARHWLTLTAKAGHPDAQLHLGKLLMTETGGPTNLPLAAKWVRKAAESGLTEAMDQLGHILEEGKGVPADPANAVFWFRAAGDKGNGCALFHLAALTDKGRGTAKDPAAALFLLKKAVEAGESGAMIVLGRALERGDRVEQDLITAKKCYTAAAQSRDPQVRAAAQAGLKRLEQKR